MSNNCWQRQLWAATCIWAVWGCSSAAPVTRAVSPEPKKAPLADKTHSPPGDTPLATSRWKGLKPFDISDPRGNWTGVFSALEVPKISDRGPVIHIAGKVGTLTPLVCSVYRSSSVGIGATVNKIVRAMSAQAKVLNSRLVKVLSGREAPVAIVEIAYELESKGSVKPGTVHLALSPTAEPVICRLDTLGNADSFETAMQNFFDTLDITPNRSAPQLTSLFELTANGQALGYSWQRAYASKNGGRQVVRMDTHRLPGGSPQSPVWVDDVTVILHTTDGITKAQYNHQSSQGRRANYQLLLNKTATGAYSLTGNWKDQPLELALAKGEALRGAYDSWVWMATSQEKQMVAQELVFGGEKPHVKTVQYRRGNNPASVFVSRAGVKGTVTLEGGVPAQTNFRFGEVEVHGRRLSLSGKLGYAPETIR